MKLGTQDDSESGDSSVYKKGGWSSPTSSDMTEDEAKPKVVDSDSGEHMSPLTILCFLVILIAAGITAYFFISKMDKSKVVETQSTLDQ